MHVSTNTAVAVPFVTVPGNPVEPGTQPLRTVPYGDALGVLLGDTSLEAYSRDTKMLVSPAEGGYAHRFVTTAHFAYAHHYPLTLSPDMLWLLIAQGFATHIRENAEALRHRFVAHEGKITLLVEREDFLRGFAGNDWEGIFTDFSTLIGEHIGNAAHTAIAPTFSTTGIVEKAAFDITLMDAMQHYFEYETGIICGIPEFHLEGTPEDWRQLRNHAAQLQQYDLDWWIPYLLPVLNEFIAASEGNPNIKFWRRFFRASSGGCGSPTMNGYILAFFPYVLRHDAGTIAEWNAGDYDRREAIQKELSLIFDPDEYMARLQILNKRLWQTPSPIFQRNEYLNRRWFQSGDQWDGYTPDTFASGLSIAPFTLRIRENTYPMEFVAGFVGVAQEERTFALRPEIGWAVRERAT